MPMRPHKIVSALLFSIFITVFTAFGQNEPLAFYLTWTDDPSHSMVVDWHLERLEPDTLFIREKGKTKWSSLESDVLPYPFSTRYVHRISVQGLKPAREYEIKFGNSERVYFFRTMPKNLKNTALKIAIGGDSMHQKEWLEKTNGVVSGLDPDFVIIGGDMAYENGVAENVGRIYDWFDAYSKTLVTAEGRILPCLVAAGNHEVVRGYHSAHQGYVQNNEFRNRIAPYFYGLFAFPGQPGYNVLDFGDYLSLIILDTEHSNPILGAQTDWLKSTLAARQDVAFKLPIYHVPAYPSVRAYGDKVQTLVRETWTPIFEQHGVQLAFENHDHAYKRTFPIKNMQVAEGGIVYVGDGSWGVTPRDIHPVDSTWYLQVAQKIRAFTLLTLEDGAYRIASYDEDGNVIDQFGDKIWPRKKED